MACIRNRQNLLKKGGGDPWTHTPQPHQKRVGWGYTLAIHYPLPCSSLADQTLTLSGESLVRYSATDCSG